MTASVREASPGTLVTEVEPVGDASRDDGSGQAPRPAVSRGIFREFAAETLVSAADRPGS